MKKYRSDLCFGDSHWEAMYPDNWNVKKDKSIKGHPVLFFDRDNSELYIWLSRDIENCRGSRELKPWGYAKTIKDTHERQIYLVARLDAYMDNAENPLTYLFRIFRMFLRIPPQLVRYQLGSLVGYLYESKGLDGHNRKKCVGYLAYGNWVLHIHFLSPSRKQEQAFHRAKSILGSIKKTT